MYLTRGGEIYLPYGALRHAGIFARVWSSAVDDDSSGHTTWLFHAESINLYPSSTLQRFYGFTDRKAEPTIAAVRRVGVRAIEVEVERIERRRISRRGPVEASVARAPQRASSQMDEPATS